MTKNERYKKKGVSEPSYDYFLFSDRQWSAAKWRWEFLRLNEDYKRDFKQSKDRGEKSKAVVVAAKWGLRELIDPNLNFKDICGEYDTRDSYGLSEKEIKYKIIEKLGGFDFDFIGVGIAPLENLKLSNTYQWNDFKRDLLATSNALVLVIDISLPDEQIRDEVIEWVREYRAFVSSEYSKAIPQQINKDKLQWSKYETWIKIWELKQQGYTHEDIADELFPGQDLDTARTRVSRNLHSIRKLINGGYRAIK